MKKQLWMFTIMMVLVIVFAVACGESEDTSGDPPATDETEAEDSDEETGSEEVAGDPTAELSNIVIASGPIGGNWYTSASAFADLLMQEIDGLNVTVTESSGEANIEEVASGNAHIGYTYSDTLFDALEGQGTFEGEPRDNLVGFGTLFPAYFHAFTTEDNDEVHAIEDLASGVHLLPGQQAFAGQVFTKNLLENYFDVTYEDIEENGQISFTGYTEMSDLLRDGHADVATAMTSAPSGFVMELNSVRPIRFLEVDPEIAEQVQEENTGFYPTQIPADAYDGISEPVDTVGSMAILIASDDLPEELGYRITEVILDNLDSLAGAEPMLEAMDEETHIDIFDEMPVHPSVEEYLAGN